MSLLCSASTPGSSLKVKARSYPTWPTLSPLYSQLPPSPPRLLCSSHAGLLNESPTHQAQPCLTAFSHIILSVLECNSLRKPLGSLISFQPLLRDHFVHDDLSEQPLLWITNTSHSFCIFFDHSPHGCRLSRFSHVQLFVTPSGFSIHGILQARVPEWVAMPSSRGCS